MFGFKMWKVRGTWVFLGVSVIRFNKAYVCRVLLHFGVP